MTDHIGQSLMLVKEFVRFFNCVVMIIAHPTKAVFDRGSSRVPGLADIEGSMNWYNKCDNGLIIWRDLGRNSCKVISAKVREIGAGKTGECYFAVDPATGIFTPQHGAVTP